jgi:folate-dependent phosphoribosylglycinamide formyltransferase PurN
MLNVHPAPLPRFGGTGMYGVHAHRAVLASRATVSGVAVHFVDEVYDHGATVAQWPVPILPDDDEQALAARVLRAEHLLFPRVVQAIAQDGLRAGAHVHELVHSLPAFDPALDDTALARLLDRAPAR